jgi:hypothetical protein
MNTITYRHHNQDRQCDPYIIHAEQVTKKPNKANFQNSLFGKVYMECVKCQHAEKQTCKTKLHFRLFISFVVILVYINRRVNDNNDFR